MSRENKNVLTEAEKILMTLLIIVGLMPSIRGSYWITNYNTAVHESPFYETLDKVAPLYGLLLHAAIIRTVQMIKHLPSIQPSSR